MTSAAASTAAVPLEGFGLDLASALLDDLRGAVAYLEEFPPPHPPPHAGFAH